jgi:hypothetical protein
VVVKQPSGQITSRDQDSAETIFLFRFRLSHPRGFTSARRCRCGRRGLRFVTLWKSRRSPTWPLHRLRRFPPHACGAGRNGTAAAVTLGGRECRSTGSTSSRGKSCRPLPEGHKVEEVEDPLFFIRSGQDGVAAGGVLRAFRQTQDEREKGRLLRTYKA